MSVGWSSSTVRKHKAVHESHPEQTRITSWQSSPFSSDAWCWARLSPDLLRFYAGKPDLLISEFLAENQSIRADSDGDFSDWIEIYNASDQAQSLEGWSLTDDFKDYKMVLPLDSSTTGAFLLVWASGKNRTNWVGDLHTNFKLSSGGEYLALIRPNGRRVAHEYLPKYSKQVADISFGLNQSHRGTKMAKEPLRTILFSPRLPPWLPTRQGSSTSKPLPTPEAGKDLSEEDVRSSLERR